MPQDDPAFLRELIELWIHLREERVQSTDQILHYSSADGLKGILSGGKIWATNAYLKIETNSVTW